MTDQWQRCRRNLITGFGARFPWALGGACCFCFSSLSWFALSRSPPGNSWRVPTVWDGACLHGGLPDGIYWSRSSGAERGRSSWSPAPANHGHDHRQPKVLWGGLWHWIAFYRALMAPGVFALAVRASYRADYAIETRFLHTDCGETRSHAVSETKIRHRRGYAIVH